MTKKVKKKRKKRLDHSQISVLNKVIEKRLILIHKAYVTGK